jgi:hypothetical protein
VIRAAWPCRPFLPGLTVGSDARPLGSAWTSVREDIETTESVANQPAGYRIPWAELPLGAKAFRLAHVAFGIVNMAGLGYVWLSAAKRRRDRWLGAFVAVLCGEGIALLIGRGNCPFGQFQRSLGDPVPMFELVLPPKAAKAAIPILAVVTFCGFAALLLRPPRRQEG